MVFVYLPFPVLIYGLVCENVLLSIPILPSPLCFPLILHFKEVLYTVALSATVVCCYLLLDTCKPGLWGTWAVLCCSGSDLALGRCCLGSWK